jgi:ribonuclease E
MADAVLESHTHQDASRPAEEGEERRERRSRDRYGRDRRERGERPPVEAAGDTMGEENAEAGERRQRYPSAFASEEALSDAPAEAPATARGERTERAERAERAGPAAPSVAPAPSAPQAAPAAGMPKVRPFELPVAQLAQIAEGSGLQWVNSDAQKIAAAQAAMAAEPKPVHVPRERPPIVVVDEGPLVLVETKRDLQELRLPFEQTSLPL